MRLQRTSLLTCYRRHARGNTRVFHITLLISCPVVSELGLRLCAPLSNQRRFLPCPHSAAVVRWWTSQIGIPCTRSWKGGSAHRRHQCVRYAADRDSPFHDACRAWLEQQRGRADTCATGATLYEFLRVTTHPRRKFQIRLRRIPRRRHCHL